MRQPGQKMRFTDTELSLMKALFADNEDLLFIIRKVMLQFKLTEQEEITLRKMINDTTHALLKKVFLPELDPDAPLFQLADMVLGLSGDIKDKKIDDAVPYILAKQIEIDYISQQMKVLEDLESPQALKLSDMADLSLPKVRANLASKAEVIYTQVLARNYILSYVDTNVQQIKYLAGLKDETVEETKARLAKDSSK